MALALPRRPALKRAEASMVQDARRFVCRRWQFRLLFSFCRSALVRLLPDTCVLAIMER